MGQLLQSAACFWGMEDLYWAVNLRQKKANQYYCVDILLYNL